MINIELKTMNEIIKRRLSSKTKVSNAIVKPVYQKRHSGKKDSAKIAKNIEDEIAKAGE